MNIKNLIEQRNVYYDDVMIALQVVRAFIVRKNRILYGGMAIDLALKHAGEPGIYSAEALPDYDFWSPDFMADSIELADILYAESERLGLKWDVSAINATHATTRRVRINFIPVADITYIPVNIYDSAPTLTVPIAPHVDVRNKVRIVHPDFQRMDIHRAFSTPLERPPIEVFFNRGAKDQHRGRLLATAYPIAPSRPDIKTTNLNVPYSSDVVYGGLVAYGAYIMHWAANCGATLNNPADKAYILPVELTMAAKSINLAKWPVIAPVTIISDEWQDFVPNGDANTYMSKYMDDFCPRRVLSNHTAAKNTSITTEIFDNKGRLLPIQTISVPGGQIRVACVQNVLLYLMQRAMAAREDDSQLGANTEALWRAYYYSLECIVAGSTDPIFNLSAHVFGRYNISADLLNSMYDKMQQMAEVSAKKAAAVAESGLVLPDDDAVGGDDPAFLRPKFGYYPDAKLTAAEKPTFDPSTSALFAIDGRPCQPFEPTIYPFLSRGNQ